MMEDCLSLRCFHPYDLMTNDLSIVAGLEYKLRKLIDQHRELQAKLEESSQEIRELRIINEQQLQTIKSLEEKIKITTLTRTVETKEGTAEARTRINELVREIDKCIGLLNS